MTGKRKTISGNVYVYVEEEGFVWKYTSLKYKCLIFEQLFSSTSCSPCGIFLEFIVDSFFIQYCTASRPSECGILVQRLMTSKLANIVSLLNYFGRMWFRKSILPLIKQGAHL